MHTISADLYILTGKTEMTSQPKNATQLFPFCGQGHRTKIMVTSNVDGGGPGRDATEVRNPPCGRYWN